MRHYLVGEINQKAKLINFDVIIEWDGAGKPAANGIRSAPGTLREDAAVQGKSFKVSKPPR